MRVNAAVVGNALMESDEGTAVGTNSDLAVGGVLGTPVAFYKVLDWQPDPIDFAMLNSAPSPKAHETVMDITGKPIACTSGTDFGQACPQQWTYVPGGLNGPACLPPPDFEWPASCLEDLNGKHEIPAVLETAWRRRLELNCGVRWPCKGQLRKQYDDACPSDWTFNLEDGFCEAPWSYDGPCARRQNFLMYTNGMKETWEENCGASWREAPPAEPAELPQPRPPRDDPTQAIWASCVYDYKWQCPRGYRPGADGICQVNEGYNVPPFCRRADTQRWTGKMKEAWAKACHVAWPCLGDVRIGSNAGLALGLLFL